MKNSVFTYNDELIKISVVKEVERADKSIEADVRIDDEDDYKVFKKNGVSVAADTSTGLDPSLLSLINKCI